MESFIKMIEESISLKNEQLKITPETKLIDNLGMTSLDMMIVLFEIEHRYNKKIPLEDLRRVKTVKDLFLLIK